MSVANQIIITYGPLQYVTEHSAFFQSVNAAYFGILSSTILLTLNKKRNVFLMYTTQFLLCFSL